DYRPTRRRDSDAAASSESALGHPRGGRSALGLGGPERRDRPLGPRELARDRREKHPARPRRRSAVGAAGTPRLVGRSKRMDGRLRGAGLADRGSGKLEAAPGSRFPPFAAVRLRALQGREAEASELVAAASELAAHTGQAFAATWADWEAAVLYNGLSRYEE